MLIGLFYGEGIQDRGADDGLSERWTILEKFCSLIAANTNALVPVTSGAWGKGLRIGSSVARNDGLDGIFCEWRCKHISPAHCNTFSTLLFAWPPPRSSHTSPLAPARPHAWIGPCLSSLGPS